MCVHGRFCMRVRACACGCECEFWGEGPQTAQERRSTTAGSQQCPFGRAFASFAFSFAFSLALTVSRYFSLSASFCLSASFSLAISFALSASSSLAFSVASSSFTASAIAGAGANLALGSDLKSLLEEVFLACLSRRWKDLGASSSSVKWTFETKSMSTRQEG